MNNNWKQKLKKSMKRGLAGFVGAAVLVTSFPLPDPAFAQVNYEDLTKDKATIINKAPVTPVKLENGQAVDLIQNPAQPAIYTLRTDYMVPKGQEWKINYQPYVASVGKNASDAEKEKVNKEIELPELKGYDRPEEKYQVTYADIVAKAKAGKKTGVEYLGKQEFLYSTQEKAIQVKHVFQDLYDFNKYGKRKSDTDIVYTKQTGKTGSMLEVQPLQEPEIPGFVPEASQLSTLVPENTENFVVEYRYNRKTFEVDFDTNGGTPIASRQLYYEQTIPTVQEPTKVGSDFVGWKPSVELNDSNGNRFAANALMTDSTGNAIKDLKTDIVMPAMNVTFTAVWQDKPKAEYVIQFWTEKTDYDKDNTLPLRDRYDFIGARRIDDADTGSTPELTNLDIHGITFPDLNDGRLEKAQDSKEEFERYYFLNEGLTKKQNASKENPNVQKSVLSTGETVYNVYYDRRVYTLYFTAANELAFENAGSFWPIITREGQVIGKEGSPYKVDVRFNQSLNKIWPKDAEVSNLPPGSSDPKGDTGLIGWIINNNAGETVFRDTPPYRLSAEDFIDNQDVVGEGELEGFGHSDEIPIKDGENKKRDKYEISLGSTSLDTAVVHHIDIIKDDFDGKEQIDYDMSYWKSDTNAVEYPFILPNLQGFALKEERREAEWVLEEPTDNQYRTINDLNRDRNKITPFRSDADKIKYIPKFPWGTKLFKGKNAYNYANYTRNKYKLKLNNDPKTVKNDSEYGEGNIIDVPYELPLKDLKLDTDHVPERPDWVHEDWSFLGWALDPAGENLVKDGKETKLHYDQVLYAKWGEPKTFWTVTVDPAEGKMKTLNPTDIVKKKATVDEKEYPVKEPNQGANQIFTVSHKQQLKDLPKPTRQGYDFLGWEWVRHNEDGSVDNSYRKTYHVPELYPFGNDVVGDVYLKAIWVENNRVNLMAYHHFIDDDGMELKDALKKVPIVNVRAGQYTSASGFYQNEDWILASPEELVNSPDPEVQEQYKEYNDRVKFDNTDFHTIRVEPAKIPDENGEMVENPDAKNNVFHFYYRHFKTRNYKVNYLDERGREEMKEATTPEAKKEIVDKYSIIPQENVVSKNRHFDARNYRPIPGWKLVSAPQQQLFYDVDEETGEFLGINGTGSDEITFYYKDVRVIEVPKDGETPKGYVRVTFKADKGGSFGKDANDKEITELNYDVIKGLKSDLLPVPGDPVADDKKEAGKYYVTPETGKKFVKWDEKPLLNKNTLVENETQDFYVFTAKFEWSGLTASGLVRTEAFKDPSDKWTNNFAPTIDDLKKQLVWKEKDQVKDLPAGTVIKLYDEADNELTIDDQVYDLVNEKKAPDKDEVVRTVNIKAKVTFTDGKDPQELDIPITVYKNVYEALNKAGDKPLFLKEAEGKEAKDGGLKDVTGEYVKVTVKASKDFNAKDDKIYYVNKNAWVEIPEVKTEGSSTFVNWTADKPAQNEGQAENGIFDFGKRHKFTENTVISPSDAKDVAEQTDPNKKPPVPDSYVKVIVKTTDKATTETAFEKTFWVNPKAEVAIGVTNPTGKTVAADPTVGATGYTMAFSKWESNETTARTWTDKIVGKFENETTIVAKYSVTPEKIKDQVPTSDTVHTPQGKTPTVEDITQKITPPEGKTIKTITIVENPDVNNPGESKVKVIVEYTDGSSVGTKDKPVEIPVEVHKNIIPEAPGGQRPKDAMDNYVKVIFTAGTGGTVSGDLVYYVSPEVEVNMTESAKAVTKTPSVGYTANGGTWSPEIKAEKIENEKTYEFNFVKSKDIVEKTSDDVKKPEGYVTVKFIAGDNGEVVGGNKIYYVNPEANIKLVDKATQGATNELVVPEAKASDNYRFTGWVEEIDYTNPIKGDREHVAKFTLGQVTLTYDKGGADVTGDLPKATTVNHGTTVRLAGPGNLAKENATFAGWKIGNDTYKAGDEVTLNENTTATAQWSAAKHNVVFDLAKGTIDGKTVKDSVKVDHGATVGTVTDPVREGYVFTGWKAGTEPFDPAATPVNSDVTLVAQWEKAVEKIGETDTVDEKHFIKVIFKQGSHGQLVPDKDKQDEKVKTVTYKVAKDYTFNQAKEKGLVVPGIAPAKYYKAKAENDGWDKALELNKQNIEFTAQYEPLADVIPVDPNVTPDDKLQEDKPEGMVLVEFVVDGEKAFMDATSKFYVVANKDVTIMPPTVYNRPGADKFEGWEDVTLEEGLLKGNYTKDTKIYAKGMAIPEMKIQLPQAGDKIVYVIKDLNGATGKMEVTVNGQKELIEAETKTVKVRKGRRIVNETTVYFTLPSAAQSGDSISYWAEKDGIKSPVKDYTVK